MIDEALRSLIERFNRKVDANPKVRAEVEGLEKTITVRLKDGPSYSADLRESHLGNLRPAGAERPDLTIVTDAATFEGLMRKEIGPMKALATRKLSLEGSLEDKLRLRKLL